MKKFIIVVAVIFAAVVGLYYIIKPSDKLTSRQFEFITVEKAT